MKWATIIFAGVLACGCVKRYTETELRDIVRHTCEYARVEARMECMSCGCSLARWRNCGGGGDLDVRNTEDEIDRIVSECRTRINEANKRLDEKLRKRAEKAGSKYEGAWSYAPREFTDAEKTRAMVNEVTARTVGVK